MASTNRFPVTITYKHKKYSTTTTENVEVLLTLINDKPMCIERMPNSRVFQMLGQQKNEKATYVLYLELSDPNIPQQADVTWTMYDQVYTGKVKFTQPYARTVLNRKGECYIQSDNQ